MSVVAEFEVQSEELAFAATFEAIEGAAVELVTEAVADPERPVLFFWARAPDFDAFEDALGVDPSISDVTCYAAEPERRLYRAQITAEADLVLYPLWTELGADLLRAEFSAGRWQFRVRLPDRGDVATMRDWFAEQDATFSLRSAVPATGVEAEPVLTERQAEALDLALRRGYFAVPREASLSELAEDLDVSAQAVSERLRRGTANLLADHFDGDPIA